MRRQFIFYNQLLFTTREILHRDLRPFITEQHSDPRAELFGSLELFGNFGRRKRVVDPIAPVTQYLDLGKGVSAALFLRHHYVDINPLFVAHRRRYFGARLFMVFDQIAQDYISHGESKGGQ